MSLPISRHVTLLSLPSTPHPLKMACPWPCCLSYLFCSLLNGQEWVQNLPHGRHQRTQGLVEWKDEQSMTNLFLQGKENSLGSGFWGHSVRYSLRYLTYLDLILSSRRWKHERFPCSYRVYPDLACVSRTPSPQCLAGRRHRRYHLILFTKIFLKPGYVATTLSNPEDLWKTKPLL